jgi:hypothetical protein
MLFACVVNGHLFMVWACEYNATKRARGPGSLAFMLVDYHHDKLIFTYPETENCHGRLTWILCLITFQRAMDS